MAPVYLLADAGPWFQLAVRAKAASVEKSFTVEKPFSAETVAQDRPVVSVLPYTDTKMQILEVFKGEAGSELILRQVGGEVPASSRHPEIKFNLVDDPLYELGSEHILFLVNVRTEDDERIHRIVNPSGRYRVDSSHVSSPAEFLSSYQRPTSYEQLVLAIQAALDS